MYNVYTFKKAGVNTLCKVHQALITRPVLELDNAPVVSICIITHIIIIIISGV